MKTNERRVSDRRVSLAVTEYAALECERLRAVILEQSRVADAWLNRYSTALGDMDKLRAVNAELLAALETTLGLDLAYHDGTRSDCIQCQAVKNAKTALSRAKAGA